MAKSVLIISPEYWSEHFVSKHHYAMMLADLGYHVYFLNPPDVDRSDITVESVRPDGLLHVVHGPRVAPGLRLMPALARRQLESRWLSRLEEKIGRPIDIVWLFENSRFYDMRFAGDRLKLYYRADLFQNYHPETAAATCDVMFTISESMRLHGEQNGAKAYMMHHGYRPHTVEPTLSDTQFARFAKDKPNAVLVGNLDILTLNTDLIVRCAERFPDTVFHFVGKYTEEKELYQRTKHFKNIVWWGKVPHTGVMPILRHSDVQLVCYRSNEYEEQLANSHKLIEYLASGKAVVSTYVHEMRNRSDLIEMTRDYDEFLELLANVLNNLNEFNSATRMAARQGFALDHTYDKQIQKIFDAVKKEGFGHKL